MENQPHFNNLKNGYESALTLAWKELDAKACQALARKSGCPVNQVDGQVTIELPWLSQRLVVNRTAKKIRDLDSDDEVIIYQQLITLHYLNTADGVSLSGKWVSYRDLPGGHAYFSNFCKRANEPLRKFIDREPEAFFTWLRELPGRATDFGDFSCHLRVLPRVPVLIIYWRGDEEMDSALNVLFDETALHYLSLEDLVVLAQMVIHQLIRMYSMKKELDNTL